MYLYEEIRVLKQADSVFFHFGTTGALQSMKRALYANGRMKVGNEIGSYAALNRKIINQTIMAARKRFKKRSIARAAILGAIFLNIVAFPINVSFSGAQASLGEGSVEVWWPTNGSHLSGVQPFKAMVSGLDDTSQYEMYWQVDQGQENRMDNSNEEYPHKESPVDLSSWTWHGKGPYEVTFVAKKGGVAVAKSSVTIYNDGAQENTPTETSSEEEEREYETQGEAAQNVRLTPVDEPPTQSFTIKPMQNNSALFVDSETPAAAQAKEWSALRPADAALMSELAAQPTAKWLGGWSGDVESTVRSYMSKAGNNTAVFVAYNIPQRDCGGYSAGGLGSKESYLAWINGIARGIGAGNALVVLEPDALAAIGCLSQQDQERRLEMLSSAVSILKANTNTNVYIDAGHSGWASPNEMAGKLQRSGIAQADGFSLNVSNFMPTNELETYGKNISERVGGKHFVIDTSRNGNGSNGEWCNPSGRKVGEKPTLDTGETLVDAYLWIKMPGESDGSCNGAPTAGAWWPEYALSLLR